MLFENKTPRYIAEMLKELRTQEYETIQRERQSYRDYYAGGEQLASTLIKHPLEDDEQFARRKRRFASINYVTALADEIVDCWYGPSVERRFEELKEQQEELLSETYAFNSMHKKMLENGTNTVVLGDGFMGGYFDEARDFVRYRVLDPNNILTMSEGSDYERLQMLVEWRTEDVFESGKLGTIDRAFLWTPAEYCELVVVGDSAYFPDGGQVQTNPYGVIPYAHWKARTMPGQYLGLSLIADAVTIQKEINNRNSALTVLVLSQGFSQFVLKGELVDQLKSSETGFIQISKEGEAYYIQPDAPIAEVQASIEWLVEKLFETGRVPISVIRSGSATSGVQLAIEYKPLADIVEKLKVQSRESEEELFDITTRIYRAHGRAMPEKAKLILDFPESFLPTDKAQEVANDLMLVNNIPPLMSREQFLKKWNPDLTDEDVAKRIEEIDASYAKGRQMRGQMFPTAGFLARATETPEELEQ